MSIPLGVYIDRVFPLEHEDVISAYIAHVVMSNSRLFRLEEVLGYPQSHSCVTVLGHGILSRAFQINQELSKHMSVLVECLLQAH